MRDCDATFGKQPARAGAIGCLEFCDPNSLDPRGFDSIGCIADFN